MGIKTKTEQIEKKIAGTVADRKEFLDKQYTRATDALTAECTRVKELAQMQANTQFEQQKQTLEMQHTQLKNQLAQQEQQEKYAINQRAAQAQQQQKYAINQRAAQAQQQ